MAYKRDRILELEKYIKSLGITVNLGKNRAQGNKGFFKTNALSYRIDISKNLSEDDKLRVLVHEIIHYFHYINDKSLKSLDFIFSSHTNEFEEDLLKLTVDSVPKNFAEKLFKQKEIIISDIKDITEQIRSEVPNIKLSDKNNKIKKDIQKFPYKYLLKFDRVRVLSGFNYKIYTLENLKNDFQDISPLHENYLKLCSLKRNLNRINNKISRINRYYNSPTELLARSFEYYWFNPEYTKKNTPNLYNYYTNIIKENKFEILKYISEILS